MKIGTMLYNMKIALLVVVYHIKRTFNMYISIDELATIGEQLRYGHVAGGKVLIPEQMGASEVVRAASGRFGFRDANGRIEIADSGDTTLTGFVEHRQETTSSTEGGTKTQMNISFDAVYKVPITAGTLVRTMFGKTCDLLVSSNIQGADLSESNEDVIQILGGDIANNQWVLCRIVPAKMIQAGVV